MTIKIIELINGEKLIGEVTQTDNLVLVAENIFAIVPTQTQQNGGFTFSFAPWPVFKNENEDSFSINKTSVTIFYTPNENILNHYNRATAQKSGIILPPSVKPYGGTSIIQ